MQNPQFHPDQFFRPDAPTDHAAFAEAVFLGYQRPARGCLGRQNHHRGFAGAGFQTRWPDRQSCVEILLSSGSIAPDVTRQPGKVFCDRFLWADEVQNFVSKFGSEYQAVARSAGGCTVYLTQNCESFRRALKNDDAVDSLRPTFTARICDKNAQENLSRRPCPRNSSGRCQP
jgi:hypothetical protein